MIRMWADSNLIAKFCVDVKLLAKYWAICISIGVPSLQFAHFYFVIKCHERFVPSNQNAWEWNSREKWWQVLTKFPWVLCYSWIEKITNHRKCSFRTNFFSNASGDLFEFLFGKNKKKCPKLIFFFIRKMAIFSTLRVIKAKT